MKILLSGASSFTGFWFAKALAEAGHQVTAPVRRSVNTYDGVRGQRTQRLCALADVIEGVDFGSDGWLELLDDADVVCHHAADVRDYRSEAFDIPAALADNTRRGAEMVGRLADKGSYGLVITGSVFEPDEGAGSLPLKAFSPYGQSKAFTSQMFEYWCDRAKLPVGKFVIPNPFGPFEEPRFTAYLLKTWRAGETPEVRTPDYVRDNIPVDLLALAYVRFVEEMAAREPRRHASPSGYIESQGAFSQRFAQEMSSRLAMKCPLIHGRQTDFSEPLVRINRDPVARNHPTWSERKSWDDYAEYYRD